MVESFKAADENSDSMVSEGVKSSVSFSVSAESGLPLPCGFSRDRVDIACITASAMRGMSAAVKLVECAVLFVEQVERPVVELLSPRFPGRLLPSLSTSWVTSRGALHDLVLQ